MSKKNIAVIVVAIILIIIMGIKLMSNNKDTNGDAENSSQTQTTNPVATKKSNGTFEIYNTDIKTNTGSTRLRATVRNISGSKTEQQIIEIALIDKEQNEVGTIMATIPSLEDEGTTEISSEDLKVYENIYDFRIKQ